MIKILKSIFVIIWIISLSCSLNKDEPIMAITELKKFSHSAAKSKFHKVIPIKNEEIYGDWTIVASYFTVIRDSLITTFGLEGRKYNIFENGKLKMDNSALGVQGKYRVWNKKWKLKSNNTILQIGEESYYVRVKKDTMEWIKDVDKDFIYFVLVK